MKKFILYIIILLLLPGNVYLAFLHRKKPQVQLNLLNTINSQYCATEQLDNDVMLCYIILTFDITNWRFL